MVNPVGNSEKASSFYYAINGIINSHYFSVTNKQL